MRKSDSGRLSLIHILKDVTVLCFTEAEDAYSENMLDLIRYLGQYREKEDYEKLQKYEPAKQAYDNALKGICRGAESEDAKALQTALEQAVSDSEAIPVSYTHLYSVTDASVSEVLERRRLRFCPYPDFATSEPRIVQAPVEELSLIHIWYNPPLPRRLCPDISHAQNGFQIRYPLPSAADPNKKSDP